MKLSSTRPAAVLLTALVAVATAAVPVTPSFAAGTLVVTSALDDLLPGLCDAHCTLREALLAANASAGTDEVAFAIGGGGPAVIAPLDALPKITEPVVLDATTQPGFAGAPLVTLTGTRLTQKPFAPIAHGLEISGGGSTVRGFVINGFPSSASSAIRITGAGGNTIVGNYVGTSADGGASDTRNAGDGIEVDRSAGNVIGGRSTRDRNVVSGNTGDGIVVCCDSIVQGNFIGTDATGSFAVPNGSEGVSTTGGSNVIGGTAPGAGNVISGNRSMGVTLCCTGGNSVLQGNLIGTDASGGGPVPNGSDGVYVVSGAHLIGGSAPGARNVISGNLGNGITLNPSAPGQRIQGNYIGTDSEGVRAVGNKRSGISSHSGGNLIGSPEQGGGNVVSANGQFGIATCCTSATENVIQGNHVGTDHTGTTDLGNVRSGIDIASDGNIVGGAGPGEGNLSSGNERSGIAVLGDDNVVLGNRLGTDGSGSAPLGNGHDGVRVLFDADRNRIGGLAPGEANSIGFNRGSGVTVVTRYVRPGQDNVIRGNSIFANDGLGIDLSRELPDGSTPNDLGDGDEGGNGLQNWPVLHGRNGRAPFVRGVLGSAADAEFVLDLYAGACDADGHGEGARWLSTTTVRTDTAGNAGFTLDVTTLADGERLVATATDARGNTSEFSNCA